MKLITKQQITIKGRGDAFVIGLKQNKLPTHRNTLPKLLGQQHSIDGVNYVIRGYEVNGLAKNVDTVALFVRPA